jgi:hypothetical protein
VFPEDSKQELGGARETQEKDGEKGTECGWVDIIYHDLSLLEAQNVGGGLDPEKSLAGGLNIVP